MADQDPETLLPGSLQTVCPRGLTPRRQECLCVQGVSAKQGTENPTTHIPPVLPCQSSPKGVGGGGLWLGLRAAQSSLQSQELPEAEARRVGHPRVPLGAGRTGMGEREGV